MKCRLCGRECPPSPEGICGVCADKEWDEFREAVHQYAQRIGLYDSIKEQRGIK